MCAKLNSTRTGRYGALTSVPQRIFKLLLLSSSSFKVLVDLQLILVKRKWTIRPVSSSIYQLLEGPVPLY